MGLTNICGAIFRFNTKCTETESRPYFVRPSVFGSFLALFFLVQTVHCEIRAQIEENNAVGSWVASVSSLSVNCNGKLKVKMNEELEVDRKGDIRTRVELDRESLDCVEKESQNGKCVISSLVYCPSPFKSENVLIEVLDKNDNPPSFSKKEAQFSMPENTPQNTMFALDVASDPDSTENGVKRYSLVCENCDEDSENTFRLVDDERRSTDGAILPKIELRQPLDHEEKTLYVFSITAFDADDQSDSYTLKIDVTDINDNAPIFSQSTLKSTIPEDQPVGSVVGSVEAHDLDSGKNGEIEYGFSTQESLPETVRSFQINSTTGEITLVQSLKNQGGKDHEVIIYAKDKAASPLKDELTWKFSILEKNDFVPQITFTSLENTEDCQIPENNEIGHVIGYFEVADNDEGEFGQTEFRMVNGSNLFTLSEQNGFYFLESLVRFNREEIASYVITVRAWDCRDAPACDRLETIDHMLFTVCDDNDNRPVFEQKEIKITLQEEEPPGVLAQFQAFDRDAGLNGEVLYYIPEVDISSFFSINQSTGVVSSAKSLDRELLTDFVEVPVIAEDKGRPVRRETGKLLITLKDINDNAPRFVNPPRFLELFENANPGAVIGTIQAVDDDKANAKIIYSLSANSSENFAVAKHSGHITALTKFDYENEETREFTVWVVAREETDEALTNTLPLKIEVIDKNDNYPTIDSIEEVVDIPWDADDGYEVTRIIAHDIDSRENGRLNFVLRNERDRFDINRKTGVIMVRERPNIYKDKDATFQVQVEIQDSASPYPLSIDTSIYITFTGNVTLYNHTEISSIRFPMTWNDIEGLVVYIALGAVLFVILIILIWVTLVFKCRRSSYKDHRVQMRPTSKFIMEQDIQYNHSNSSKRASAHFGSNLRSQNGGGGYGPPDGSVAVYLRGPMGDGDDHPNSSKDVSPNSALNDDSVVFANEMNTSSSIPNIHENPLAVVASSPSSGIGGLNSSQSSFDTSNHNYSSSGPHHRPNPSGPGAVSYAQVPSPLPKLKLEGHVTVEQPPYHMGNNAPTPPYDGIITSQESTLPYNYPMTAVSSSAVGRRPSSSNPSQAQTPSTYSSNSLLMHPPGGSGGGRRQISEPVDTSTPFQHHGQPNEQVSRRMHSGSPEPAGSDSSSFDSGRGSEALVDPMGYNSAGHLATIRGAKSLPNGKKSRHAAPAPMYGDHREDDCWQPRVQESSTLPGNNRQHQQQQQSNNPDIPTKGGILITPSRQILQPPASNHEKWNLPRDANSFKQNQPGGMNGSNSSPGANTNSNGNINRIGLSELEPIAENFALERMRGDPNYIPDVVRSSAASSQTGLSHSGSNHSLHKSQQQQTQQQQQQNNPTARTTVPPKRTPPAIPLENDSRTAVV